MKNLLFLPIIIYLCFAFTRLGYANTIFIHTDNLDDLYALKSKNIEDNLSVATNLHALNSQSTNVQFEYMTTKRSLLLMDNNENICVVNKVKTKKRQEKYLFSQPVNLFLSRRIYQNESYQPVDVSESADNSVLLSDIFIQKPTAIVIISRQISYGDALDAQIANLHQVNVLARHSSEHDTGVIAMFVKGRAEFALLYPHQVYDSDFSVKGRSYAIASIPPYILGHLMCTKNKASAAFIQRVNKSLSTASNVAKLLEMHLQYTNPIDKVVIESYFHQEF